MISPALETITQSLNYADLPETWRVPKIGRFSVKKTLYDYQTDALEKAAKALYLYYEKGRGTTDKRKQYFETLYQPYNNSLASLAPKRYESRADEKKQKQNQVFRILSDFMTPQGDLIPYHNLINRMCFWMATGSGKTLVMVKLIEYLNALKRHGEIPSHNVLILAPSDHLIRQIHRTVDEFNQSGLSIELVPLRQINHRRQMRLGDAVTVYYHRSDNISDVQKDALTDYRTYENNGKWYVLLDEAHKGGKDESKRQAYYAVMARNGFLFNFSATFTDETDITTTVKKYNLEDFIKNGHGKNIYLNEREFTAFKNSKEEINHDERRKIVLKSLITLAYVSMSVHKLRRETGVDELYHLPLMLTLVNSVNTDIEKEKNDLWAFFQTLREIATGEIDATFFRDAKNDLINDWQNATLLFGQDGEGVVGTDENSIKAMKVTDLRAAVFLSRRKGALQFIRSGDSKELAFQMKNADSPFALIRIGDTSKWRNELLAGYEETTTLPERSFFDELEQSKITILMGSRSFFESWDSNRPNVINFINIGGRDAKKFVVQSVGRGVRIETLPGKRKRLVHLLPTLQDKEQSNLKGYHNQVQPPETLFLFATNQGAVKTVLEGLETEKGLAFERLEGFEKALRPKINGADMQLFVPKYKDEESATAQAPFVISNETQNRFKVWLEQTSDSVFAVRDGLSTEQISTLRGMFKNGVKNKIQVTPEKNYAMISFLQNRLISHLSKTSKASDGVKELNDEDIVHFCKIRVYPKYVRKLQDKINQVKQGKTSDKKELAGRFSAGEITQEEFDKGYRGEDEATFKDLTIKKLLGHYYLPLVLGNKKAHYIQHIIKVKSEIEFLNALEQWMEKNKTSWDAWMFSKLDESLDQVHIPYYDNYTNEYRRFLPDFVFWMCRGNEYRIAFVDPKGIAYTAAEHKIDGYRKLFEKKNGSPRVFSHRNAKVQVKLLMFNTAPDRAPEQYRHYWTNDPGDIFSAPYSA